MTKRPVTVRSAPGLSWAKYAGDRWEARWRCRQDIRIEVAGNIERLEADACNAITVTGDVGNVATQSGDVDVRGGIRGSVSTMSGDVDCGGPIGGSVSTMSGDIKHR